MIPRFVFARQHPQAVGDQAERCQYAVALLLRTLGDHRRHLGILYAAVDLVGVGHPLDKFLGRWAKGQQMGEDLLRRFGKELTLLVCGRLIERGRNRLGLGAAAQLLGRPPVGAAGVKRVENDVAVFAVIEPLNKLAGGIVDDGRMTPFFDLQRSCMMSRVLPAPVSPINSMFILGGHSAHLGLYLRPRLCHLGTNRIEILLDYQG